MSGPPTSGGRGGGGAPPGTPVYARTSTSGLEAKGRVISNGKYSLHTIYRGGRVFPRGTQILQNISIKLSESLSKENGLSDIGVLRNSCLTCSEGLSMATVLFSQFTHSCMYAMSKSS